MAIEFAGKFVNSYMIAILMIAQSFTVYEMFANEISCEKLDIEKEGSKRRNVGLMPFV